MSDIENENPEKNKNIEMDNFVRIRGLEVKFPYKPYRTQVAIVSQILGTLNNDKNMIIESPTGTGKSLSLLCGVLTWLNNFKAKNYSDKNCKPPKIFYGVRTIRQSVQIVSELRKLEYPKIKVCTLASRQFYCNNIAVANKPNIDENCTKLLDPNLSGECPKYKKYRKLIQRSNWRNSLALNELWDLEELNALARYKSFCPYFLTKELLHSSDIIVCPYNYLIDELIKKSSEISTKGNIIILDEAHNVEDVSREAASKSFSTFEMYNTIDDIEKSLFCKPKDIYEKAVFKCKEMIGLLVDSNFEFSMQNAKRGVKVIQKDEMKPFLQSIGLDPTNCKKLSKEIESICQYESKQREQLSNEDGKSTIFLKNRTMKFFERLLYMIRNITENDEMYLKDYCLFVYKDYIENDQKQMGWNFTMEFKCLSARIGFKHLLDSKSIFLASGTLSPLESFESELGTKFPHKFSSLHIVNPENLNVTVVTSSKNKVEFYGNFKNLQSFSYFDEIGLSILGISKTSKKGILIFMPSYFSIEKMAERWNSTGLMKDLESHKKLFFEPKISNSTSFDKLMNDYRAANSENGAILFGVYRGKLSEGIDFKDDLCRIVCCIGIPYPNVKEPLVKMKMEYNDSKVLSENMVSGQDWYDIQAFRALNQAIGRCIRHVDDWGSMVFMDSRLRQFRYKRKISKWLRYYINVFETYESFENNLSKFNAEREKESIDAKPELNKISPEQKITKLDIDEINEISEE